ncbi:UGT2A1.2 family protein [Megaselia abdita]
MFQSKMIFLRIILFLSLVLFSNVTCYNILVIFPHITYSHYNLGLTLSKGLAEKGHNVTLVAPFKEPKQKINNLRTIYIFENSKYPYAGAYEKRLSHGKSSQEHVEILERSNNITKATLENKDVQDLLKSKEHFDLMVFDFILNDAFLGVANTFNVPAIAFSSVGENPLLNHLTGVPLLPSFVPHITSIYSSKMTFLQRVHNFLSNLVTYILIETLYTPTQEQLYNKHFPDPKPSLIDLRRNISLVISNSHPLLRFASPQMPNFIEVGGLHLKKNKITKIPSALNKFIEDATYGVIYFSLGSTKGADPIVLPDDKIKSLLEGFKRVPQRVLFKCDLQIKNFAVPDNVFVSNWFPQESVIAHPNVKLYITHGGKGGLYEAIFYAVPIIGIPLGCDNHQGITKLVHEGFGVEIDLDILTANLLESSINEVLVNNTYQEKANLISKAFRHHVADPLELAVHWVEHVIKHKSLFYMQTNAMSLSVVQYFSLDSIFLLFIVSALLIYGVFDMLQTHLNKNVKTKSY